MHTTRAIIFIGILFSSFYCISQNPVLQLQMDNIDSGQVIMKNTFTGKVDSLAFSNGNFIWSPILNDETVFTLVIDGYNNLKPEYLVLSTEKTVIHYKDYNHVNSSNIRDLYPNEPEFLNDPNSNHVYFYYREHWLQFYEKIESLSVSDSDSLIDQRKKVYENFIQKSDSIISANRDKLSSTMIIHHLMNDNLLPLPLIQKFYDQLSPTVKGSVIGIEIGEDAGKMGRLSPGNPAPPFSLVDKEQNILSLDSLKGKTVILHFWSSSCAPCIKEAPQLIEISETLGAKAIVLNISLDTDKEKWLRGIENAKMEDLIHICDLKGYRSGIVQDYNISLMPTYIIINGDGVIEMQGGLKNLHDYLF